MTSGGELLVRIKNDLSRNERLRRERKCQVGRVWFVNEGMETVNSRAAYRSFRNNHTRTDIRNYYQTF